MRPLFKAELAQARALLDVIATRLSALPANARAPFDAELERLRGRWEEAKESSDERVLEQVQDGILQLISGMDARFAGHPPPA